MKVSGFQNFQSGQAEGTPSYIPGHLFESFQPREREIKTWTNERDDYRPPTKCPFWLGGSVQEGMGTSCGGMSRGWVCRGVDIMGYVRQVVGTHPTGMLSCYLKFTAL